jgi:hypothetical protein
VATENGLYSTNSNIQDVYYPKLIIKKILKYLISALLYVFLCREQEYVINNIELESFWQNSEL